MSDIIRAELKDFIGIPSPTIFPNSRSLDDWLKEFPNVRFDLKDWLFGKGTVYIKGSASDLQKMASEPDLLVEFHESVINALNTTKIEYVQID